MSEIASTSQPLCAATKGNDDAVQPVRGRVDDDGVPSMSADDPVHVVQHGYVAAVPRQALPAERDDHVDAGLAAAEVAAAPIQCMQPGTVTGHWPPCEEPCNVCDGTAPIVVTITAESSAPDSDLEINGPGLTREQVVALVERTAELLGASEPAEPNPEPERPVDESALRWETHPADDGMVWGGGHLHEPPAEPSTEAPAESPKLSEVATPLDAVSIANLTKLVDSGSLASVDAATIARLLAAIRDSGTGAPAEPAPLGRPELCIGCRNGEECSCRRSCDEVQRAYDSRQPGVDAARERAAIAEWLAETRLADRNYAEAALAAERAAAAELVRAVKRVLPWVDVAQRSILERALSGDKSSS